MRASKLVKDTANRIRRRTRPSRVHKNATLPTADLGYEQLRHFSSHRNGWHLIYKTIHALNILYCRGVTRQEICEALQAAPKCGGRAFFISANTVRTYLTHNNYNLWRRLGKRMLTSSGNSTNLYVAAGLTSTGQHRGR